MAKRRVQVKATTPEERDRLLFEGYTLQAQVRPNRAGLSVYWWLRKDEDIPDQVVDVQVSEKASGSASDK